MPSQFESVRPAADQVRQAVTSTLRMLGSRGCATWVAGEFGDHPETAVPRMTWALAMVRGAYPHRAVRVYALAS